MVDDVQKSLGRMEGKLDGIEKLIKEHHEMDTKVHEEQENRLRSLELSRGKFKGVLATLATLASILGIDRLVHYFNS